MKKTTLAAAIALATVAAATTPAPAQAADVRVGIHIGSQRPGYYQRGSYDVGRIAYDNGYRDGLREGNKDDRSNDRYGYRDEGRWRSGDAGYRYEYGPRYAYISSYRRGFEEGYRRGYANWNSRRGYRRY